MTVAVRVVIALLCAAITILQLFVYLSRLTDMAATLNYVPVHRTSRSSKQQDGSHRSPRLSCCRPLPSSSAGRLDRRCLHRQSAEPEHERSRGQDARGDREENYTLTPGQARIYHAYGRTTFTLTFDDSLDEGNTCARSR